MIVGLCFTSQSFAITDTSSSSEVTYYEQKKLASQEASTKMRLEYYEKYKTKWGYDLSILTAELLDGKLTEEYKFWEALKLMQNKKEIPERRIYVEKLKKYGADTSEFTEDVIADSGKFWAFYKKWEWVFKNPPKYEEKNIEKYSSEKYGEKNAEPKSETPKKDNTTIVQDRIIKIFIARLDAIPKEKLQDTLTRLEKNITRQLERAKSKSLKTLTIRLEKILEIVKERMDTQDDDALLDELFGN